MRAAVAPKQVSALSTQVGRSLTGKKKVFQNMVFSKTTVCSSYVQPWLVVIGGWWLVEIAGWRLVVGGWRRLAAVGGSWQLVMGGWWRLAAVDGWRLAKSPKTVKTPLSDNGQNVRKY